MPDSTSPHKPQVTHTTASPVKLAALPLAIIMLIGWAVWTFAFPPAPGWVHLFLTLGVFLLVWAIVARDTVARPRS